MAKRMSILTTASALMLALWATSAYLSAIGPRQSRASASTGMGQQSSPVASAASADRALLDQYCVTCHNEKAKVGGLALDTVDVARPTARPEVWEKVIGKLRGGMMPPPGRPRPDQETQDRFRSRLEAELDRAAATQPNPGRTETFHRLNRHEYQNTVRDLLGIDDALDIASLLPVDDQGYGFDTIAGVLKLSPTLIDRYLSTARKVARVAVGTPPATPVADVYKISSALRQYDRVEGLPFGTRGGTLVRHNFPQDGEYLFRVNFTCSVVHVAGCDPTSGFDDPHTVLLIVDGEVTHQFTLEPTPIIGNYVNLNNVGAASDPSRWDFRLPIKGGPREVGVTFAKLPSYEPTDWARTRFIRPSYEGNMVAAGMGVYQPYISALTITGPLAPSGSPKDTPSRQRIFVCQPATSGDESRCAKQIMSALARRGYRRPVMDSEVRELLRFYDERRKEGGDFEAGIEVAIQALLMSPDFLVRIEADPATPLGSTRKIAAGPSGKADTAIYRIGDLDLASRLSFFLWSSMPDDQLLDLAAQGKLKDPAVFDRQVRRMIADPRSRALTNNFLPQWLLLPKLDLVSPAVDLFPAWDDSLRRAMDQETKLFFDSILREDRSVLQMLTANYTFLNERLALHYGIPGVRGEHFRRIALDENSPRRGLLGHASILTLTSPSNRTSPVFRGKWILDNLLGAPPPPPPADVPSLPEPKGGATPNSIRERMAAHRRNPVCAGCHTSIDPAGFALENFDAIGRWREVDESLSPIDPAGSLPDGTSFKTLAQFREAILSHPDRFVTTLTEKMLTYALGRGLEFYDMPAVRAISREMAHSNYRMSSLVLGIVKSLPFRMRRVQGEDPGGPASARLNSSR